MNEREHDLFLLMFGLAELEDEDAIRQRFCDAVTRVCPEFQLHWVEAGALALGDVVEVATPRRHFGWISVTKGTGPDGGILTLRTCIRLLALVLEERLTRSMIQKTEWAMAPSAKTRSRPAAAPGSLGAEDYEALFAECPIGLVLFSAVGYRVVAANRLFCDMVGYSTEEVVRLTLFDLTQPDDLEQEVQSISRLLSGDLAVYTCEKRFVREHGLPRWGRVTGRLVLDLCGEKCLVFASVEEIATVRY
jgi:PAS domain S-box-containing protein